MAVIRYMSDLSTYPLQFEEPLPAVLRERLHFNELSKLVCVTTTAALKEWLHFRMHGAGYKSDRSFATKFLRETHKHAVQLFEHWPGCYLCVFLDGDDKQPGRVVVHIVKETVDHLGRADVVFPAPSYFAFPTPNFTVGPSFDGSLPYLIYTEYLDQKGLLFQED